MRSHAIAVSLQTKTLEKYACVLSKYEERNDTAIVSQKIDIKVGLKMSLDQEKQKTNWLSRERGACLYLVKIMFLLIPMKP